RSSRVTRTRIRQLGAERRRIVPRQTHDPRAVISRDEARQRRAVVMRRDGRETAAADGRDDRPLRLDPLPRLLVIGGRDEMRLAGAHLQREGALPRLRKKLLRLEPVADLAREAEPVETARRQHDGVETALPTLAQPRVD